jgi:hypothetical protein
MTLELDAGWRMKETQKKSRIPLIVPLRLQCCQRNYIQPSKLATYSGSQSELTSSAQEQYIYPAGS